MRSESRPGNNVTVPSTSDHVRQVVEALREAELIPPVNSVEQIAAGWVRVTVPAPVSDDLRARIAEAVGHMRWTLHEVP